MLGLEQLVYSNLVGIFGGNVLLLGIFAIIILVVFLLIFKIPLLIIVPAIFFILIIMAPLNQGILGIVGLLGGTLIGLLILKLFGSR